MIRERRDRLSGVLAASWQRWLRCFEAVPLQRQGVDQKHYLDAEHSNVLESATVPGVCAEPLNRLNCDSVTQYVSFAIP